METTSSEEHTKLPLPKDFKQESNANNDFMDDHSNLEQQEIGDNNYKAANESELRKQYFCSGCNKAYANLPSLTRHIENVHEGKRNQVCPICGKSYTQDYIRIHIKTHEDKIPSQKFPCVFDNCGHKCNSEEKLFEHFKSYHEEHHCDICGKMINGGKRLQEHVNFVHYKIIGKKFMPLNNGTSSSDGSGTRNPDFRKCHGEMDF